MEQLLEKFVTGQLVSLGRADMGSVTVANRLSTPIRMGVIGTDGELYPNLTTVVPSYSPSYTVGPIPTNWYLAASGPDGSLAAVYPPSSSGAIDVVPTDLSVPGDIGPVPTPTTSILVPNDSPSILVAVGGRLPSGNHISRSQFWKRAADSLSLAPGEKVTTSYTATSGMQSTSSDTETVATSLSTSASAGWGPISASISASLNTSSTKFQQYVTTETDTRYESRTYVGDKTNVTLIIRWQLMDVVTVLSGSDWSALSQITTAQHPDIVQVYTSPPNPPALLPGRTVAEEDRDEVRRALAAIRSQSTS